MVLVQNLVLYDDVKQKVDRRNFATALVDVIMALNDKYDIKKGNNIEVNVYYDKEANNKSELLLVGDPLTIDLDSTSLAEKPSYRKLGTIGNVDIDSFKELIRVVDKDLSVYEINDGEGIKRNQEVYSGLNKRKMKRTFIDSSFGIRSDLRDFLIDTAVFEKWYDRLDTKLENIIQRKEIISE